jgi:hypothetical protein|tara:strand:- start:1389 stop:1883 length:495 start_codon:yes stop_codon:yes gene_type:complete
MGCQECKSKQGKQGKQGKSTTIPLVPEGISNGDFGGNFLFKVVAFAAIVVAIPFLIIILLGQTFITFFLPKIKFDFTGKLTNLFKKLFMWYGKRKATKELKKKEEEFKDNLNYDGYDDYEVSDDYEVYEGEEYTTEDILEDVETLKWENLSNPKVEKGDNKKGE